MCTIRAVRASQADRARAQEGFAAWQRGDARAALAAFEDVAAAGVASPALWLLLAQARAAAGAPGVDDALDRVLAAEPRNRAALVMKGDRAPDDRGATAFYSMALAGASDAERRDPAIASLLDQAAAKLKAAEARFVSHLHASIADHEAGARFEEAVALVTGAKALYLQQPTSFFFPGLPHRQFFEPGEFAWAAALTEAAPAIAAEVAALRAGPSRSGPYVVADSERPNRGHALLDDPRWSAFHLLEHGEPVADNAARCPATMAAIERLPLPIIAGRSPMALFSVLAPGTHIPPHNGMLNTRLICHLPLIVPPGCALRVGNETRAVEAGKLMIFDDSIEHEAWNGSNETRIILLFEIWRPELTEAERAALTRLFESVGLFAGGQ